MDENEPECGKGIPFPIQTFLWRQTRFGLIHSIDNRCFSPRAENGASARRQPPDAREPAWKICLGSGTLGRGCWRWRKVFIIPDRMRRV